MSEALDLLNDTERLLEEAKENLHKLQTIGLGGDNKRLAALIAKQKDVKTVLVRQKIDFLTLLIQLMIMLGEVHFKIKLSGTTGFTYTISNPTSIWIYGFKGENLGGPSSGPWTLEELFGLKRSLISDRAEERFLWQPFCRRMIDVLREHIKERSETINEESVALEKLMAEIQNLLPLQPPNPV